MEKSKTGKYYSWVPTIHQTSLFDTIVCVISILKIIIDCNPIFIDE